MTIRNPCIRCPQVKAALAKKEREKAKQKQKQKQAEPKSNAARTIVRRKGDPTRA